jgi:hypothetical protein
MKTIMQGAAARKTEETPAPRRLIDLTDIDLLELYESARPRLTEPEWMTREQTAEWLVVSLPKVDSLSREGMPYVRLGRDGVRRYSRPAVREWLAANGKSQP